MGLGANIEAAKEDILQAISKIIVEENVDLIIATTVKKKWRRDKVHVSGGIRCEVSGQTSLYSLVFPETRYVISSVKCLVSTMKDEIKTWCWLPWDHRGWAHHKDQSRTKFGSCKSRILAPGPSDNDAHLARTHLEVVFLDWEHVSLWKHHFLEFNLGLALGERLSWDAEAVGGSWGEMDRKWSNIWTHHSEEC